jgi:hypothetical protein
MSAVNLNNTRARFSSSDSFADVYLLCSEKNKPADIPLYSRGDFLYP